MSQQLFEGRQPVADTSVNPLDWVYSDDVPQYREDLAAAAALLDEAGWSAAARTACATTPRASRWRSS